MKTNKQGIRHSLQFDRLLADLTSEALKLGCVFFFFFNQAAGASQLMKALRKLNIRFKSGSQNCNNNGEIYWFSTTRWDDDNGLVSYTFHQICVGYESIQHPTKTQICTFQLGEFFSGQSNLNPGLYWVWSGLTPFWGLSCGACAWHVTNLWMVILISLSALESTCIGFEIIFCCVT